MLISEYRLGFVHLLKLLYVLIFSAIVALWINQDSANQFWQQYYHRDSFWSTFNDPLWRFGARFPAAFGASSQVFITTLNAAPSVSTSTLDDEAPPMFPQSSKQEENQAADNDDLSIQLKESVGVMPINREPTYFDAKNLNNYLVFRPIKENVSSSSSSSSESEATHQDSNKIEIHKNEKVFFAGDSMMEGVAPHMMRELHVMGVSSINLSQKSTGLAYPHFFNWPKTIEDTLNKNKDIGLIVIFLGPNDCWDMPPEKGVHYLKFGSSDWEVLYKKRITDILEQAKSRNIHVIWVGPPYMRKESLSKGVTYLDSLYSQETMTYKQTYLSVNDVFHYSDDHYSDYFSKDNEQIKLRSGDGIHFSITGQKMIAKAIVTQLSIIE